MAHVVVSPTPQKTVAIVHAGPRGAQGVDGAAQDFEHVQASPSAEWIINHNLGAEPSVSVLSAGGVEMEANVVHMSVNQVRVYFASAQAGRARCV
jgi:hypothetical protein